MQELLVSIDSVGAVGPISIENYKKQLEMFHDLNFKHYTSIIMLLKMLH